MNFFLGNILPACKNFLLQQSPSINVIISRNRTSCVIRGRRKVSTLYQNRQLYWPGGQKFYGFTYYPRYPRQVEPEWDCSPLFMIRRRKPVKGQPFWLKRILRSFRIEQATSEIAIVINCEHVNKELWKIKHLITITPITFPDGIPEEKDLDACRLYPNGELRFKTTLRTDPLKMEATETFQKSLERIDKETIQKYSRKMWLQAFSTLKHF